MSLYPILYTPTRAAREAARKVLHANEIYCSGKKLHSLGSWDDWEAHWGKSVHYMVYEPKTKGFVMKDGPAGYRLVNSPAHFVASVRQLKGQS